MKTDKAFVDIGGKRLIERVLDELIPLFPRIFINSNTSEGYEELGFPVIADIFPNKGALGGIYSALVRSDSKYVFCVACDMPSLNGELIQFMQRQVEGCDVLVPQAPDGLHPLHAIYSKRCCQVIRELLLMDKLKISELFHRVQTQYLPESDIRRFDPNFESFRNLNTLHDLHLARETFQTQREEK